eukprot:5423332-Pyramimonas_sp.AAC.1
MFDLRVIHPSGASEPCTSPATAQVDAEARRSMAPLDLDTPSPETYDKQSSIRNTRACDDTRRC